MREMEDSKIYYLNLIPKGWQVRKFKNFSKSRMGETILSEDTVEEGIPIYSATQEDKIFGYTSNAKFILNNGDIVIPARGNSIGCATLIKEKIATCTQTTIGCYDIEKINNRYYYYSILGLKNEWFKYDGSAIPQITVDQVKNNKLAVPPIEEQEKIANFLDNKIKEIDKVIEKTKETIDDYKKYRQTIITEAVTKGLNKNVKFKETFNKAIGMIPESWNVQKLKTFISMPVIDGPHESPILLDDGIPYISATAIENGKINFDLMRGYISEEYCEQCEVRYKPKINDILVIKLGATTGQVAIVDTDKRFNIWVPLAAIRCNEIVNSKYIYYSFQSQSLIKQMELMWTFGTQQTLGVKTIEQLYFSLPDKEEQNTIVQYLEKKCLDVDNLISNKEKIVEELEQYKKSLIYEYVTGKKEVF